MKLNSAQVVDIATYMGWKYEQGRFNKSWTNTDTLGHLHEQQASISFSEFKYDSNWNLLMDVVEKIEKEIHDGGGSLGDRVIIEQHRCIITKPYIDSTGYSKREAVLKAVLAYIDLYNKKVPVTFTRDLKSER